MFYHGFLINNSSIIRSVYFLIVIFDTLLLMRVAFLSYHHLLLWDLLVLCKYPWSHSFYSHWLIADRALHIFFEPLIQTSWMEPVLRLLIITRKNLNIFPLVKVYPAQPALRSSLTRHPKHCFLCSSRSTIEGSEGTVPLLLLILGLYHRLQYSGLWASTEPEIKMHLNISK